MNEQTKTLWGKLNNGKWLPLYIHLSDTAEIISLLWEHWVPQHTKDIISEDLDDDPEKILRFLAAAHDIGKAAPNFVVKAVRAGFPDILKRIENTGLSITENLYTARNIPHAHISEWVMEKKGTDRSLAGIVGSHHGVPPDSVNNINIIDEYKNQTGTEEWNNIQNELFDYAVQLSGLKEISIKVPVRSQILLNGLLIMADWLASDEERFPLIPVDCFEGSVSSKDRATDAWKNLDLPEFGSFSDGCLQDKIYEKRFGRNPRPVQTHALETALNCNNPGLMIIEAPMGEGKTEAALAVAEVWAKKFGFNGVYFALPTQATSDGIFPRIIDWINNLNSGKKSIFLAHGKSGFNKEYNGIRLKTNTYDEDDVNENVVVNSWTMGRKKGLLADFVVGTVDHILMAGLKSKHLSLRHLGIVNKIVIIDECHAYDAYMNKYLDLVLKWLSRYEVPVILLSATLPPKRRQELLNVYKIKEKHNKGNFLEKLRNPVREQEKISEEIQSPYPLISFSNSIINKIDIPESSNKNLKVDISLLDNKMLENTLAHLLSEGGCAGVIRNTVSDAQRTAKRLEQIFGPENVILLHSRFLSFARVEKEMKLRKLLGPGEEQRPDKLIVVGTQVIEQSLDVDFDVLFTDICPVDLLLQRMGRLHRHKRTKPRPEKLKNAACYVMGINNGISFPFNSISIYGEYLLMKTAVYLKNQIIIPEDIPDLVQKVYDENNDEKLMEKFKKDTLKRFINAKNNFINMIKSKQNRAEVFQIKTPENQQSLIGWLETKFDDPTGKNGEATVRDCRNSLEVLVICQKSDGEFYTVPWLKDCGDVKITGDSLAKTIAGCSVSLPPKFTTGDSLSKTIDELKQIVEKYNLEKLYSSHWLKNELFLVLDENMEMELCETKVKYDEKYGLYYDGIN